MILSFALVIILIIISEIQQEQLYREQKVKPKKKANFYSTWEWRKIRYKAIKYYGATCMICGASGKDVVISVDHIKPRSLFPELALEFDNLQIACMPCNMGKSNIDFTDWRD